MIRLPNLPKAGLAAVAAAFLLAACQTVSEGFEDLKDSLKSANLAFVETRSGGPVLPSASLPVYGPGDAFAFDNGRTYTVAALDGTRITWDAGADYGYVTHRNFALPGPSWWWVRKDGKRVSGKAAADVPLDALWPLKVGNRAAFVSRDTYTGEDGKETSFQQDWKCWVAGTETVKVPAGAFDTFEIVCDRSHGGYWAQRSRWFYAPAAGHFVRRVFDFPGADSRQIDLVAYGPRPAALPAAADRLRAATVQRALEKALSNHTVTARNGGYVVAVTPTATTQTPEGVFCRDYRQQITARGRTSLQRGRACRDGEGVWRSR